LDFTDEVDFTLRSKNKKQAVMPVSFYVVLA